MRSTVVVGYDRSLPSGRALLEAGREAECRAAEIVVVHAYRRPVAGAPGPEDSERTEDSERIERTENTEHAEDTEDSARAAAAATAEFGAGVLRRHHPGLTVRSQAVAGAPDEALAAAARCADLLVMGTRGGGGIPELTPGSVTVRTLAHTSRPLMAVSGPQRAARGLVLAALDIDHPAEEVLNFAFAEARLRSARLQVLSAYDLTAIRAARLDADEIGELCGGIIAEAGAELERMVKERQDRCARVHVDSRVADGSPAAVLTAASAHADVVVSGARRLDGERYGTHVGPVTRTLLRHAACPVVIVPHAAPRRSFDDPGP